MVQSIEMISQGPQPTPTGLTTVRQGTCLRNDQHSNDDALTSKEVSVLGGAIYASPRAQPAHTSPSKAFVRKSSSRP